MALPSTYHAQDAQIMMELGYLAGSDLKTLFLPPGWDLIQTFAASFANGGAQGYFAAGTMPSTGERVAVMAVGAPWPSTMAFFGRAENTLVNITINNQKDPSLQAYAGLNRLLNEAKGGGSSATERQVLEFCQVAGLEDAMADRVNQALRHHHQASAANDEDATNILHDIASDCHAAFARVRAAGGPQVDLGFSLLFSGVKAPLLEALNFTANLPEFRDHFPVVATGMNGGAPVSQIAALNVRPGDGSPVDELVSYSFSNPPYGNEAYNAAFKAAIPGTWRVTGSVDLFPSQPTVADGYVPTGIEQRLQLAQPEYSSPWLERSQPYYNTGFTKRSTFAPAPRPQRHQASVLPDGYDPQLAYTMSLLTTVANQRFQTPGLPIRVNTSPFTFSQDIRAGGVTWAAAYSSATDEVAVAFRDTATWLELIKVVNKPSLVRWSYGGDTRASISGGLNEVYAGLRDGLRTWLASQPLQSKRILFTGSGAGGALAAIAALDFQLNPLPDALGVAGIYSFGATPIGTFRFKEMYEAQVGAVSFMVNRPLDIMPTLPFAGGFQQVGQVIHLPGGDFDPFNTLTFHPIFVYIQILNPFKQTLRRSFARRSLNALPAIAQGHMLQSAAFHKIDWARAIQGPLTTDPTSATPAKISWLVEKSDLPPVAQIGNHQVIYAVEDLTVLSGAPLTLSSPLNEPLILSCAKLEMQSGAQILVEGNVRVDIGALIGPASGEKAHIILTSPSGQAGAQGQKGAEGSQGIPPMGPGGRGANGAAGSQGGPAASIGDALFHIGVVDGQFLIEQRPGQGGSGGDGGQGGNGGKGGRGAAGTMGRGGNGGNGGQGGNGGRGGNGGNVHVIYRELGPNGRFDIINDLGFGGHGGGGGEAGIPGLGHPDGDFGAIGSPGATGPNGTLGTITIRKGS